MEILIPSIYRIHLTRSVRRCRVRGDQAVNERCELFRGVFDGRYKLVRYFGLGNYHLPQSVEDLLANNDLALYDTRLDPEEMDNLADPNNSNYDEALLATMNAKLNALIQSEIGEDKALFTPPS